MTLQPHELEELCCDLVSLKSKEPALRRILSAPPGQWHSVHAAVVDAVGSQNTTVPPTLVAAWIAEPGTGGAASFAILVFYESSTTWSWTAIYDRERLLRP